MIKAVIFDMDGLLIDSEPFWDHTNKTVFKKLGITLTKEHRSFMMGRRSKENIAYFYDLYPWEGLSPEEVEQTIRQEIIKLIKEQGALMPGVHKVLSIVKKAGLRVAIASSSNPDIIDAVVDTLELREHFDHIYSAEYEEYGKPHPGVFLKVAKHFKVSPHDCLVFEDAPSGVLAAKAARMRCVAVPNSAMKDHPFVQTADLIISSLEEFDESTLANLA